MKSVLYTIGLLRLTSIRTLSTLPLEPINNFIYLFAKTMLCSIDKQCGAQGPCTG